MRRQNTLRAEPPGSVKIHHDATGFFRYVYEEETSVLDGLKSVMDAICPHIILEFFSVSDPSSLPNFSSEECL